MNPEQTIDNEEKTAHNNLLPGQIVIVFQLAVCILIAVSFFIIKSIGGSLYESISSFYNTNMNNSLITEFDSYK